MKTKIKNYLLSLTLAAVALVATISPPEAHAQNAGEQSFGITNVLTSTVIVVGNPTNSVGTNGFLTGAAIDIRDYALGQLGIEISGTNSIGGSTNVNAGGVATNCVSIFLVRAFASGTPLTLDFETTSVLSFSAPLNGSTYICWRTNIPSDWAAGASHIGVYRATNSSASGGFSGTINLTKKAAVFRWP